MESLEKARITIHPYESTDPSSLGTAIELPTGIVSLSGPKIVPQDAEPIPHLADDPAEVAWWTAAQDVHILAFTTRGGGGWGGGIFSGNQRTNQPTLFLREPLI